MKKSVKTLLQKKNLSITKNRLAIIDCLNDSYHFHTINEIKNHIPTLNTKSIYNTIKVLEKVGFVESISINGIVRYALVDNFNYSKPQAHIYKNGKIEHITLSPKIFEMISDTARKMGKKVKFIRIFLEEE